MMTIISKNANHDEYPTRVNFNGIPYYEYKKNRPMFFHHVITTEPYPVWSESLEPEINNFKDKYSYITNDCVLGSIFFEYSEYYIREKLVSAMLPFNPFGPTGIGGRGLLGKWGPNHAADPVVITYDTTRNVYQVLVIERKDKPGVYALPGGMQDENECISKTIVRELNEETNVILNIDEAIHIYSGYVNDPRNTDHAWLETCVYSFYLNNIQRTKLLDTMIAGDDAMSVTLIDIIGDNPDYINMYANHKDFVDMAIRKII